MTAVAIVFLLLAIGIVWGGLTASALFLRSRPEREDYPPGGEDDDHRADEPIVPRDT